MRMFKKPKVRIRPGEHPQHVAARYKQALFELREKKRDLVLFALMLLSATLAFLQASKESLIPEFNTLPQYLINVEKITCDSTWHYNRASSFTYFDLLIESYGNEFLAVDIPANLCKRLAKRIEVGTDLLITHHKGLMFQIQQDDIMLASHKKLLPGIEDEFFFKGLPYQVYGSFIILTFLVYWLYAAVMLIK